MKTIYITKEKNFWRTHTDERLITERCILKSVAESAAFKFISNSPEGEYQCVKTQVKNDLYLEIWSYSRDGFPPVRQPKKRLGKVD